MEGSIGIAQQFPRWATATTAAAPLAALATQKKEKKTLPAAQHNFYIEFYAHSQRCNHRTAGEPVLNTKSRRMKRTENIHILRFQHHVQTNAIRINFIDVIVFRVLCAFFLSFYSFLEIGQIDSDQLITLGGRVCVGIFFCNQIQIKSSNDTWVMS